MSEDIKNTITDLNINIIDLKSELEKLKKEVVWFREYAHYIGENYYIVDAEAASYADEDYED